MIIMNEDKPQWIQAPLKVVLPYTIRAQAVIRDWYMQCRYIDVFRTYCIRKGIPPNEVDQYINWLYENNQGKLYTPTLGVASACQQTLKIVQDTSKLPVIVRKDI